jgi:hypothetical protein
VRSRDAGWVVAVAGLSRDRESPEAELAMEHNATAV